MVGVVWGGNGAMCLRIERGSMYDNTMWKAIHIRYERGCIIVLKHHTRIKRDCIIIDKPSHQDNYTLNWL